MIKLEKSSVEQYTKVIIDTLKKEEIDQFRILFLELHPQDQVDVFLSFNEVDRNRCYGFLSPKEFSMIGRPYLMCPLYRIKFQCPSKRRLKLRCS